MDQRIMVLYDRFTLGDFDRGAFLDRAAQIVGSAAAAAALLPILKCEYAKAQTVPANDSRLASEKISYDTPGGKVTGYLSRPKDKVKRPAIVVIHQNRGLNPHIEDVARRFALEGFLVLAPDLLSPFGGTPTDDEQAVKLFAEKINREDVSIPVATVSFLKKHAESTGKVGAVGYCFGGGVIDRLAMNSQDLDAAGAYYGPIRRQGQGGGHQGAAAAALARGPHPTPMPRPRPGGTPGDGPENK